MDDVGKRIRAWRTVRGLSQQGLAESIGVTHAAVYQWELPNGDPSKTRPSLSKLEKVVKALGVSMEQFYGSVPKAKAKAS